MDEGRISTPHKPTGNEGSIQGIESLSGVSDRHDHSGDVRQHDCSFLLKQAGGDTFQEPMHEHHSPLRLGRETTDDHNIKVVPGCLNVKADALSRRNQILKQEWSLLQQVFSQICKTWETPQPI